MRVRVALYVLGAVFEFVGIVVIAAPDFAPVVTRVADRLRRLIARIRLLLGRPGHQVIGAAYIGSAASFGSVGLVATSGASTLEEKIEFLLRRDKDAQVGMNDLRDRVATIERESPERLDQLRDGLIEHVAAERAAAEATYRTERTLGAIALAVGLILSTIGNLV
jgi:hypothetical protein